MLLFSPFRSGFGLLLLVIALSASTLISPLKAEEMKPEEKAKFEQLIREYIFAHPEEILESVTRFQQSQKMAGEEMARQNLVHQKERLLNDPTSPIAGNLEGDVTVVEFFDYRCGFCKKVHADVMAAVKSDGNVRLVYKEFPILGPDSQIASRAAMAVWNSNPDKYLEFHDALMTSRGGLPESRVLDIAESLDIDLGKLKEGMATAEVDTALRNNYELAQSLNINGTPAFVIGGELIPGAVDLATLKKMIAKARGS